MLRKPVVLIAVLVLAVNIILIKANTRLGYDIEAKIKEPPEIHVFQTRYNEGTQIVFNHKVHTEDYGLECTECHHVESCRHCHQKEIIQVEVEESKVALHKSCLNCHMGMDVGPQECSECHKR